MQEVKEASKPLSQRKENPGVEKKVLNQHGNTFVVPVPTKSTLKADEVFNKHK